MYMDLLLHQIKMTPPPPGQKSISLIFLKLYGANASIHTVYIRLINLFVWVDRYLRNKIKFIPSVSTFLQSFSGGIW